MAAMKMSGRQTLIVLGLMIVFFLIGSFSTFKQMESIKSSLLDTLEVRVGLFQQYLRLLSTHNTVTKNSIERYYNEALNQRIEVPILDRISYNEKYDTYYLSPVDQVGLTDQLSGTITITSNNDPDSLQLQQALTAVIAADEQLSAYNRENGLAIWSYYTSIQGFMYLMPAHAVKDFQFKPFLYTKPFWAQAVAEHDNTTGGQIVSDLYDDAAGQGLMVTISDPVRYQGELLGVVSLDIGIDYMQSVLQTGAAPGESMIVDEKKLLVARPGEVKVGAEIDLHRFDTGLQLEFNDGWWQVSVPLKENELFLLHRVSSTELFFQALKGSIVIWLMLLLILSLSYLAWLLFCAARAQKELALVDPMTCLYNRRGLETLAPPILDGLKRAEKQYAVILLDIDYFKKINDTLGHDEGDLVIKSIADILKSNNRKSSICTRFGGEEFLVFVPDIQEENAHALAERTRQAVENNSHSRRTQQVTVSIGLHLAHGSEHLDSSIKKADQALYQSKQQGRNRTTVFSEASLEPEFSI